MMSPETVVASKAIRFASAWFVVFLFFVAISSIVDAQEAMPGYDGTDSCTGSWVRQFGVNLLILDCAPGFATEHDRIYMFARKPVDFSADWHNQLDFTDAVWTFDTGARGKASLIIDFHPSPTGLIADIYDDRNGDGEIRYGYERGYPKSVESRFPTLHITAPDGWWVRDGKINYNLKLVVDGPLKAAFNSEVFLEFTRHDGVPDIEISVGDPNHDGKPNWMVVQAKPPVEDRSAVYRSLFMVNEADDELIPTTFIMWPHLGFWGEPRAAAPSPMRPQLSSIIGSAFGYVKDYNTAYPPIQVDWQKAKIEYVGEFVASRGRAHNWFIYSINRVDETKSVANFEDPFSFYDLAGRNDGIPDLMIRNEHYTPLDTFLPDNRRGPLNFIRYSWDQDHKKRWSYKVGVIGRRPPPGKMQVGNIQIQTVPYADYPTWVMDNPWDAVDFVAVETDTYWTSEGIYDTCVTCYDDPYYTGISFRKPIESFRFLNLGLRAEFNSFLNETPRLYLSAIDRKLHLYKAESGLWRIAENEQIRYTRLGREYIAKWEHILDGSIDSTLINLSDRLIYFDQTGVTIARGPSSPSLLLTRPPTNTAEWTLLRDQLATVKSSAAGNDLKAISDRFSEERIAIPNATMWDVRPEPNGFRLILQTFTPLSTGPEWVRGLLPGTYLVTYREGVGFSANLSNPIKLTIATPAVRGEPPRELAPTRLAVEVRNEGDQDAAAVPLVFTVTQGDSAGVVVSATTIAVPARSSAVADVHWNPSSGGDWDVRVMSLGQVPATSPPLRVTVGRGLTTDISAILVAQGLRPFTGGAVSASLTLVIAISAGLGFVIWRAKGRAERSNDG